MPTINKVSPLGIAMPVDDYPNPVLLPRAILNTFYQANADSDVDMDSCEAVSTFLQSIGAEPAHQWITGNRAEYERGLKDGFEVCRYRIALHYTDGSETILREDEDITRIRDYAAELQTAYQQKKGYQLRKREDKGTDILCTVKDAEGTSKLHSLCVMRVTKEKARDYIKVKSQKYPSDTDTRMQDADTEGKE